MEVREAVDEESEAEVELLVEGDGGEGLGGLEDRGVRGRVEPTVEGGEPGAVVGRGGGAVLLGREADDVVRDGDEGAGGEVRLQSVCEEGAQDAFALGESVGADGDLGREQRQGVGVTAQGVVEPVGGDRDGVPPVDAAA